VDEEQATDEDNGNDTSPVLEPPQDVLEEDHAVTDTTADTHKSKNTRKDAGKPAPHLGDEVPVDIHGGAGY